MGAFDDLIPPANAAPEAPPRPASPFDDLIPGPSAIGVRSSVQEALRRRKTYDFGEGFLAGLENSVPALALKRPTTELADDPTVGGRIGFQAAQLIGDFPVMIAGALVGGVGGAPTGPGAIATGMAGAFGLPAGLRATLMDSYENGEFKDFPDFWNRASHIIWETVKGQITGAATALSGGAVKGLTAAAAPLVRATAPTAAELATMTTVGAVLDGRVPSLQEILDGAIILGGMKGAVKTAGTLRTIYRETGKRPTEVVADARQSPEVARSITEAGSGDLPLAYREAAVEANTRAAVPDPRLDPEAAKAFVEKPYAEATQVKGEPLPPTEVNLQYLNTAEEVKAASARLSELYADKMREQQGGTISHEQTALEAEALYERLLGETGTRKVGQTVGRAELYARKQILTAALEDITLRQQEIKAKGSEATMEDIAQVAMAIERAALIQAEFKGAGSEAGRTLEILRSMKRDNERIEALKQAFNKYGTDPALLMDMIGKIDSPEGMAKFARDAHKATKWEKVVEAWKAGLLSGPWTHAANLLGNVTFMVMRPVVDAVAATVGLARGGGPEQVSMIEPFARIAGNLQGVRDGAKVAVATFRESAEAGKKIEQYRHAIEGRAGDIIRIPFKLLSASDAMFRVMNERGEAYTLAIRQSLAEGRNPSTREFSQRVADLVTNPPEEMAKQIAAAGERFTFNTELGETGKNIQRLVKSAHLEFLAPFIRTPINIAKELTRLTPFAPALGEWHTAIQKGGAEQAKAMAEMAIGTSLMSAVVAFALDGTITGQGDPDPGKRRIQLASGWQPYSVKIGDTYYSYQRLQPIGTLMGLAADMATVWSHMTDEESDKTPKILSVAFANAVTNQTFLQGITTLVQMMTDPGRYGAKAAQTFVGSFVPAILAQPAQMVDPLQREVNSSLEAIFARIPGAREGLLAKRDAFGEQMAAKEKLGFIFPIAVSQQSTDPVRVEAARLGISVGAPPKQLHIGARTGKIGDVKLAPEQTDKFEEVAGKMAHGIMENVIASPAWETMPDIVKRRAFQRAELLSHKAGAAAALPPDIRGPIIQGIADKIAIEMQKVHEAPGAMQ